MRINEVEARVGITKKNIRFYEEEGLLTPARNAENGYRDYGETEIAVLQKIKLLRQLSVSLEDIRRLQLGQLSLQDCMSLQSSLLEARAHDLSQMQKICLLIAESKERISDMQVDVWQTQIAELERTGVRFMNVNNDQRKKMVAPTVITVILCALMVGAEILLAQDLFNSQTPPLLMLILLALPIAVIGGVIAALWTRFREIKGGEEDEASKY